MEQKEVLTSDNFPHALLGIANLTDKSYVILDDVEVIPGKSIVVNKVGGLYLYMSDDHRANPPIQIIVKELGHYEMHFLSIDCKKAISLKNYKP